MIVANIQLELVAEAVCCSARARWPGARERVFAGGWRLHLFSWLLICCLGAGHFKRALYTYY